MNAIILFIADGYFAYFRTSEFVSIGAFKYLCHVNIPASIRQRGKHSLQKQSSLPLLKVLTSSGRDRSRICILILLTGPQWE